MSDVDVLLEAVKSDGDMQAAAAEHVEALQRAVNAAFTFADRAAMFWDESIPGYARAWLNEYGALAQKDYEPLAALDDDYEDWLATREDAIAARHP